MEIKILESSMIKPAKETPEKNLWISDLDLIVGRHYVPLLYFFKQQPNNKNSNFFEAKVLKDALSEVLVHFYPMAGRLGKDGNGRIQINCNGNGALFIEAQTASFLDDFGDFTPCPDMLNLVPNFNPSHDEDDISLYPLLAAQLTRFGCGSACLGLYLHHMVVDGTSVIHLVNSWSDVARGMSIANPPFIDGTVLDARVPPTPTFHHTEYDPHPIMMNVSSRQIHDSKSTSTSTKIFKITRDQVTSLKSKLKSGINYSTYEVLTAHIWYCVCRARQLCDDQETKLYIPINGRPRFDPPLPLEYFGTVLFTTTILSSAGEIKSMSLEQTVEKIHKSLKRMDDEYLRSSLSYLKKQSDLTALRRGPHLYKCPNLNIVSWMTLPLYDADFGWGRPFYVGRAINRNEGVGYLVRSPNNENSVFLFICLDSDHMNSFHSLFEGQLSKL